MRIARFNHLSFANKWDKTYVTFDIQLQIEDHTDYKYLKTGTNITENLHLSLDTHMYYVLPVLQPLPIQQLAQ